MFDLSYFDRSTSDRPALTLILSAAARYDNLKEMTGQVH